MPTIDFYIIKQAAEADALFFTCRLLEKIYSQGHKIYIHTQSEQSALALDDLLWSFRPESFLPHAITSNANTESTNDDPIIIGFGDTCHVPADVLVNLANEIPSFHSKFERIAEIVRNHEDSKKIGRQHWSFYKSQNYPLKKTEI